MIRKFYYLFSILLFWAIPVSTASAVHSKSVDAVKIGVEQLPTVFYPYSDVPLELQYVYLFFDPLVGWDKNNRIEKRLVESWKPIKKGVTRFYLKQNIFFHSGNVMTSDDVTWTYSQILKNEHIHYAFEGIQDIKSVDRYSFDVYSNISEAQVLDYLSHFFVLDALFYEEYGISLDKPQGIVYVGDNRLSISGTGPYTIKQYNVELNLDVIANEQYWQGAADISELNFIKIKSGNSRTFALLGNDIDVSEFIANDMLKTLNIAPSKIVVKVPSPDLLFLTINSKKSAVFKQPRVRKAINLAINKQGILTYLLNNNGYVNVLYSPSKELQIKSPSYDIDQAKQLLANVKMPLELTLIVMSNPIENSKKITDALVNMMKILGINLVVTEVNDIDEWNKHIFDYDLSLSQWHSTLMDTRNVYYDLFHDSLLSSYFGTLFSQENIGQNIDDQIRFFQEMQQSYRITPLLFQDKMWAADKRFNLFDIFSSNGIPYWNRLQEKHVH
jgi:peptide/nickel transport system substrate-binding protein